MSLSHVHLPGVALVLVCGLSSACATAHVHLSEPPAKTAPFEERVTYYKEHRPVAVRGSPSGQAGGLLGTTELSYVILEDGTRVDHVEDLLPTVEPGSPTAQAAMRERTARDASNLWGGAMAAAVGVGTAMMFGSLLGMTLAIGPGPEPAVDDTVMLGSLGLVVTGGAVALASTFLLAPVASASVNTLREKETAFLTYDRSLRERLDLVEYGQRQKTAQAAPTPDRLEDR
jgi:hypothetical protein